MDKTGTCTQGNVVTKIGRKDELFSNMHVAKVRGISLKNLCTVRFQLHNILEKDKQQRK